MKNRIAPLATFLLAFAASAGVAQFRTDWRYYRVGNTGIQGDICEALWIGSDGDPWIGGYDPSFEEGGIAKFVTAENRWLNVSNVDYRVIGHPERTGTARVSDIDVDARGGLWMATGRGGLYYDPAVGPASLRRFGDDNSPIPGGWNRGVEVAPDGTVWFSSYSTAWGSGGIARYNPASNQWLVFQAYGGGPLAIQPRPGGGYYVWTMLGIDSARFDSTTSAWTVLPKATGNPAYLIGNNLTDSAGNTWMYKWTNAVMNEYALDLRRPDGTWANLPRAPFDVQFNSARALRALGPAQAVVADGGGTAYRFDGTAWTSLGMPFNSTNTYDVGIDPSGNVWLCGIGGAAKRNAQTGAWQRYRITNTGNFDTFNRDLTLDLVNGAMYTGANAAPGVGGMVRFDGKRWTGWNQATYGMGYGWPFQNDSCTALAVRPSTGRVAVSPLNWLYGVHEWTGNGFVQLSGLGGAQRMVEDSIGRLWALGEYYNLQYHDGSRWVSVAITGWGAKIQKDPVRPGTVWAQTGNEILRTDGTYRFSRTLEDFPELNTQSDQFSGLACEGDGIVWVGAWTQNSRAGTLLRIDAKTGQYRVFKPGQNWPFPGDYARPQTVSPDGRLWLAYDSEYPSTDLGLCWYDGSRVGRFPAPADGGPQWGGLPHASIDDLEVRPLSDGYELWMSCVSRGIAVLRVRFPTRISPRP